MEILGIKRGYVGLIEGDMLTLDRKTSVGFYPKGGLYVKIIAW